MASTFEKTAEIKRDTLLEGYPVRIFIDGNGIRFQRKGDRSRDKKVVCVSWTDIAEIGAEKDPNCAGQDFYSYLKLDAAASAGEAQDAAEGEAGEVEG